MINGYGYLFSLVLVGVIMFSLGVAIEGEEIRFALGEEDTSNHADRITSEQIKVYSDRVRLDISGVKFAPISGTDSMLPILHEGSHSLEVDVDDVNSLELGDIISYREPDGKMVIHSIIEISSDSDGWYAITKGVNNPAEDPWKVRESWVDGVLIGVLY